MARPAVADRPTAGPVTGADRRGGRVHGRHLLVGLLLLAIGSYLSLSIGAVKIPLGDMFHPSEQQWRIITLSRMPRTIAILLAGAALAVAGLIMQRITQNSYVSPSTSGTVEAAIFGVLLATLLVPGAGLTDKMLIALATALIGTFGFLQILQRVRVRDPIVVALIGIMYGGVIGALTTYLAYRNDLLQLLEIWTTASFSSIQAGQYEPLYLVVFVGAVGYLFADRFTVVGMGREFATNLGVNYRFVLYVGLIVVSVMAATVVVVVGSIPFLGLIVPNIVRIWLGDNVRVVLPVTALAGAGFVLACDIVGRLIRYPYEIPVGVVGGVVGAGVFIWLIVRAQSKGRA
ncbi:ABC transporter permease [Nocardioides sp. GXZ039]|uniref:ABC transporter permease n=1 Tax=Nocardioides sp. GXZ039 TaxID=3136018 RepID=UPI0030F3B0CE